MTSFDCTDIKATLSGLVDDQVDAETRHLAERHLSQCAECRALVSQAESLDDLIAQDAAEFAPKQLPHGFMDSVLNRTVYARLYEQAGWNWMTWTGWVAAAACLLLASAIWVLDQQRTSQPQPNGLAVLPPTVHPAPREAPAAESRSWTYDGTILASSVTVDEATRRAIDAELEDTLPARTALAAMAQRGTLSIDDSDTLHAASVLLDMLAESDLSDFADMERAREIAVYDELPQRLADVRSRLHPADRAAVMAAESILLRIVNGPLDMNDARLLRDSVASLNLAAQVGAIGSGRDVTTSM